MYKDCLEAVDDSEALDNLLTNIVLLCNVKFGIEVVIDPPSVCPTVPPTTPTPEPTTTPPQPTTTCAEGNICEGLLDGDFYEVRINCPHKINVSISVYYVMVTFK